MSFDILFDFFKKINYKRILPLFLCPVFFFCTSFQVSAYTGDNNNFYPLLWHGNTNIFLRYRDISGNNISSRFEPELVTNQNSYYVQFAESGSGVGTIFLYREESQIDFNFVPNKYDYFMVLTCKSQSDLNFNPTRVRIRSKPDINSESNIYAFLTDIISYTHNDKDTSGFTVIGKIPDVSFTSIYGLDIYQAANVGTFGTDLYFEGLICAFPKGESNAVGSIISAINNQTTQQNNNFNNFMGSGSQFGGTTSDILSGNDELSGFIDDYTEVEQSMYDKFTENQSAVIDNFSGFAWGSLSTAVDWTSDYLNRIYDNSGDFRTMFMYPILAGIALIFIGRQGLTAYVRSRREK